MTISEYVKSINQRYKTGISREHSYRGDLQNLLEGMVKNVMVTNEPARIECGAPDFILTRQDIPVGYIEAKDIGEPLTGTKHKVQFERYKESLSSIIFTDYLDFHYYREGEFVVSVRLAEIAGDSVRFLPENEEKFRQMIFDFASHSLQTIKSASRLSKMMATRARLLSEIIENALNSDKSPSDRVHEPANTTLRDQLAAFQNVLMHDIDEKEFADIYAQTIAYGMFAARLHDTTLETFSRFEAARLIPKSNPFLRKLFQYIAGYDLDERIDWIVDALADIFRATDVDGLLNNFGKSTQQTDPVIHFYETFLAEFDPKLRKSRGVWYTPEPVVNFIVRAVDDILKDEFGLKDGLADTSKTKVKVKVPTHDKRHKEGMVEVEREVHKVQILDPAAGTGTFLAEVIKQIHGKMEGQQGIWPDYVENHLIPRLNGFEILMASYAMAHLKLDMLLKETGYNRESSQRFRVYLTNSLEEHHPDTGTLFAGWLSDEANEANHIKRDTPVMVVLGNPPYSIQSSNLNDKQREIIQHYKYISGEKIKEKSALQLEKNLNDDYIKFMAFGESLLKKNGVGVLAYINNNNFLDAPTLRGMRWNLMQCYDKIYVIDLHGNSYQNERTSSGEKDENVFDIQQGVSINIFIKNSDNNNGCIINHIDVLGNRSDKYEILMSNELSDLKFKQLEPIEPEFYFVKKNTKLFKIYKEAFSLNDLLKENVTGVKTHRDHFIIGFNKGEVEDRVKGFYSPNNSVEEVKNLYILKDTGTWNSAKAKSSGSFNSKYFKKIHYRPFDILHIYYDDNLVDNTRESIMRHVIDKKNVGLIFPRQAITDNWSHIQVSANMADNRIHYSNKGTPVLAPLYIYPENGIQQNLDGNSERKPNLNVKILKKIADGLGLTFTPEKEDREGTFAPIDLLDYIYAVLHSPTYRETYKEFLKIDFPRVPYPDDPEQFWKLVELGGELRQLHLMEHPVLNEFITTYPKAGSNEVTRRITKTDPGFVPEDDNKEVGKVWINDEQYFGNVPLKAWEFYIGGYQPAQKWLKDRRGRTLSMEEIQHYQKIIVALMETDRVMWEVDGMGFFENNEVVE